MKTQENEEARRAWQFAENLQIQKIREAMTKQRKVYKSGETKCVD